ncbi:hypothetical protein ACFV99_36750 [Streptomyces sp. NPDC059944]|uniref:hypothetical protein n=1 Tax=unclassified Streptomyces TaxID=2593676 RepID=UPI00363B8D44
MALQGKTFPAGFTFRPYRGDADHVAMAEVRLRRAGRDRIDPRSVVEGLPTAAEIADSSATLDEPSKNQILVVHDGSVVGYVTNRWQERDDTQLYRHRGHLVPEERHQGIGSAVLNGTGRRS